MYGPRGGEPTGLLQSLRATCTPGFGYSGRVGDWTPEQDALLGTLPDAELARRLNRSPIAVQTRRAKLGKPKLDPKYPAWTPAEEALLGSAPDTEIAARISRQKAAVTARRLKLGIAPALKPRPGAWRPEEEALLGSAKDEEVARRLKRTLAAVRGRRKVRGIKSPAFSSPCRRWTPEEDALLGTMRDEQGPWSAACIIVTCVRQLERNRFPSWRNHGLNIAFGLCLRVKEAAVCRQCLLARVQDSLA